MDYKEHLISNKIGINDVLCFEISNIDNKTGYGKITVGGYEQLLALAQSLPDDIDENITQDC